jgi:hypothetical protein
MAAIASIIPAAAGGAFVAPITTLTASDTLTFRPQRKQLLVLRNPTGGSLTLNIDGDGGTTVAVQGIGPVSVAAGFNIAVPAGESRAVILGTISAYCKGVVTLTGANGMVAQLFDL